MCIYHIFAHEPNGTPVALLLNVMKRIKFWHIFILFLDLVIKYNI